MTRYIPLIISLLIAAPAYAADFLQDDWQGGAVSGSTTNLTTGLTVYDSQDGNAVVFSTGIQIEEYAARSWVQTDDGAGDAGFNRIGSVFSSATVSGTGASANLHMVVLETMTVSAVTLPQPREDLSAVYHPPTGNIYLLGGRVTGEPRSSSDVFKYTPLSNTLTGPVGFMWAGVARRQMASAYHPGLDRIIVMFGDDQPDIPDASDIRMRFDPSTNITDVFGIGADFAGGQMVPGVYFPPDGLIYLFGQDDINLNSIGNGIDSFDPVILASHTVAAVLPSSRIAMSAVYHPGVNKIYMFGGWDISSVTLDEIIEFDPVAVSTKAMTAVLPSPRRMTSAVYYPPTGNILIFGGTDDNNAFDDVLEYDPVLDTLTVRPVKLPLPRGGMGAAYAENTKVVYLFGGSSGPAAGYDKIYEYRVHFDGNYTAAVFDTGNLSQFQAISWSSSIPTGTSLGVSFRTGDTPVPDGSWSNGGAFAAVANGGSVAAFGPARYVQYAATFTTVDMTTGSAVNDLTITYTQTPASATFISAAFDSGANSNQIQKISWQGTFPANTTAQFQLRTAPDGGGGFPAAWNAWLGPTGSADFYASPGGSDTINALHRDFTDDRWFQYRAVFRSSNSFNTPSVATVTVTYNFLPSSPTVTSLTADNPNQLTVQWSDNSTNEDEFIVSSGTASGPSNIGATVPTADKSGIGGSQSTPLSGLIPNTQYFVRLRGHVAPPDDFFSSFSNELSTFTLAEAPSSPQTSAVFESSLTLSWSGGANPGSTPYEVSLSTDGFVTDFSTPVPFSANLTATTTDLLGLDPGTTYYLRVRARNGGGIETAFSGASTPTLPSALSGLSGSALGVSSITWTWNTSGPAARYRVYSASSGALLAEVGGTNFPQVGLSTNTAAGLQVEPFNESGSSGLSPPTTSFTLAAPPLAPTIDVVAATTIQLSWSVNTNPAGTIYELSMSTDGFATHFSTPVPLAANLTTPTTSLSSLDAGTTHYFRVRAANGDLVLTTFTVVVATQTLPGTVSGLTGTALGVSSVSWSWTNTAGPAVSSYDVFRASDNAFLGNVPAASFSDTSLATNTAYGIQVSARNDTGAGALSASATTFTAAAPPSGTAITATGFDSVSLAWDANTNPIATNFEVERSTDDATFSLAATVSTDTHTDTSLAGPTTYYFRVRALNGDGLSSVFDVAVSTLVLGIPPLPPSGLTAESIGGDRIRLGWTISPTTTVAQYNIYFDNATGVINYGVLFASVTGDTTSYVTSPLISGQTYKFGLRAQKASGTEEANISVVASAAALASLTGVRSAVRAPASGLKIAGDRITMLANLSLGAPGQIKEVRFQYKASTAAVWWDIVPATLNHPNPDPGPPYYVHWDVSGLTATNYDLRAIAKDTSDVADGTPPTVTVTVDPVDFDIREFSIGGGRIQKDQKIHDSITNILEAADGDGDFVTRVVIPPGALVSSPLTATVVNNPANAPAASGGVRFAGIIADISLSNGQTILSGGNTAALSFIYTDSDGDGLIDGTLVRTDELRIFSFGVAQGKWRQDFASAVDSPNNTLAGSTPHFSFFGAFGPAHADLSAARVYPNPFKPNSGSADDGVVFAPGNINSGIIFDNLPEAVTIKVYTVSGQLVRQIDASSSGGRLQWDAKNDDGKNVASGGYFAVVASPGQETVVKKIGIIR